MATRRSTVRDGLVVAFVVAKPVQFLFSSWVSVAVVMAVSLGDGKGCPFCVLAILNSLSLITPIAPPPSNPSRQSSLTELNSCKTSKIVLFGRVV